MLEYSELGQSAMYDRHSLALLTSERSVFETPIERSRFGIAVDNWAQFKLSLDSDENEVTVFKPDWYWIEAIKHNY